MKRLLSLLTAILLFATGCITSDEEVTPELTKSDKDAIAYFKEIALGFQRGGVEKITRKWTTDMRLFIGGNPGTENLAQLDKIRREVNALTTDGFSIEIVTDSARSNAYIFFGTAAQYSAMYPTLPRVVGKGYFNVYWKADQVINHAHIFIDTERTNQTEQKAWLISMLTGSIGLGQVSPSYSESVFSSGLDFNINYSTLDKELIRLLYHPRMSIGLDEFEVETVLESILLDEKD